jgi:predicted acyltransferase
MCGWFVGVWLRTGRTHGEKIAAVFSLGVLGVILGLILDYALMPINKQIWTPSYVVYTAGLACLGLGLCYWIIDILGYRKWALPLIACGMNAITIFVLAGIVGRLMNAKVVRTELVENGTPVMKALKPWLYETIFVPMFTSPLNASLAWAITFVAAFIAIAIFMHRMRWYIKV